MLPIADVITLFPDDKKKSYCDLDRRISEKLRPDAIGFDYRDLTDKELFSQRINAEAFTLIQFVKNMELVGATVRGVDMINRNEFDRLKSYIMTAKK